VCSTDIIEEPGKEMWNPNNIYVRVRITGMSKKYQLTPL
jgi:hypothetical protein